MSDIYALNFRPLTGRSARFDRSIRAGRLYRSGELSSREVVARSTRLDLAFPLVVDLRYAAERERNPAPWQLGSPPLLLIPDDDGTRAAAPHMTLPDTMHDPVAMRAFFDALYRELPFEDTYRAMFPRALRAVAESEGAVLIHCTGGKDRTGILIALIQHILGFDREAISSEYMRTNDSADLAAMAPQLAERLTAAGSKGITTEVTRRIMRVHSSYLAAAFDEIERRCGSIDAYLALLGIETGTIEKLRTTLMD